MGTAPADDLDRSLTLAALPDCTVGVQEVTVRVMSVQVGARARRTARAECWVLPPGGRDTQGHARPDHCQGRAVIVKMRDGY
ncbi:MAG: hypothetical protein HYX75_24505 [Acidobacteria bacterium]|nr:hypothetical protein [Acidobacteriota bacterium]